MLIFCLTEVPYLFLSVDKSLIYIKVDRNLLDLFIFEYNVIYVTKLEKGISSINWYILDMEVHKGDYQNI